MDVLDSTIVMIMVSYKQRRFFRCSYLIRHFYQDEAMSENPPEHIVWDKLFREIKTDKPIITLYDMVWDENAQGNVGGIRKEQFIGVDMMATDAAAEEQKERDQTMLQLQGGKTSPAKNSIAKSSQQ